LQVSVMQEELKILQPQLVVTQAEVAQMMAQITVDKAAADETRIKVKIIIDKYKNNQAGAHPYFPQDDKTTWRQ
jgi:hypothetical protein